MTSTSRNQNINELRARIRLLEKQLSDSRHHMQEKLLAHLVTEAIRQADDPDDLLFQFLERVSVILDLPLSCIGELSGNECVPLQVFDLRAKTIPEPQVFPLPGPLLKMLKVGPLLLSASDKAFPSAALPALASGNLELAALFPFQSIYIPSGIVLFFTIDSDRERLEALLPVLMQLIESVAEKLEKLKLMQELKDLNRSFEEELERRTAGLKSEVAGLTRKNRELQKRQKRPETPEAAKPAEDPEMLKSFLKGIGMEVRTPLNGIMGFAELIRDNDLRKEDKNKYIDIIKSCGKSLLKIVDDALEYSIIKSGRMELKVTEFPLAEFMTEIYDHYKKDELFRQRGNLELKINLNINGATRILADRDRLMLVLTNLIGNAIKFTESGTIEFGCSIQEPKGKRGKIRNPDMLFFVKDTGIGISKEHGEQVFQEFYKVEHEIARLYGGLGLGLTISRELVGMMDGSIWFTSEEGKGSSFYFSIPEAMLLSEADLDLLAENGLDQGLDWREKKILIVEDDAMSVIYLKEALKSTGAQLMHASDGKSAVDVVTTGIPVDVILMDIKLPGMSGYDATRKIKSLTDIPIIAQTAYAMADDHEKIIQAGFDDYISKPINRKKLLKKINDILTRGEGPAGQ